MTDACLFCRIAKGEIPTRPVYEDDHVFAFPDLHPQAPVHILVIPKRHFSSLDAFGEEDRGLMGHLLERAAHVARLSGIAASGYRTILNTNAHGGQEVFHIHIHVLGGGPMGPMVARPKVSGPQ